MTSQRGMKLEAGMRSARSVLECGGLPPLSSRARGSLAQQSARGLAQSKTWRTLLTLCVSALITGLVCLCASAQPYAIDWHTIDGGGGISTGGVYVVSGTIGQPDAGPVMSGGTYTLQGGFWAVAAVQVPGAPVLTIVPAGSAQATISWEPDTPGWVLQETLSLSPTNWMNSISGSTNPVVVPATGPTKFYRLHKP